MTSLPLLSDLEEFLEKTPRWLDPNFHGHRDYKRLYQMLKENPTLARERISYKTVRLKTLPFQHLLATKAPLEVIHEVYEMFPDVIRIKNDIDYYPLHDALIHRCKSEVISFLVKEYPSAVTAKLFTGKLPIDILLQNFLTKELQQQQRHCDDDDDYEDFIKQFKVLYNSNPSVFWQVDGDGNCEYRLMHLMEYPKTPPSLLEWLATRDQADYGGSFDDATLTLNCSAMNQYNTEPWIQNLKSFLPALASSSWCKEIKFKGDGHFNGPNCIFIEHLFSKVIIPPNLTIHFHKLHMNNYANQNNRVRFDNIAQRGWIHCQVEEIKLTDFVAHGGFGHGNLTLGIGLDIIHDLLRNLQYLPNLKRLFLTYNQRWHLLITNAVIELLEKATSLDILTIKGKMFVKPLLAAIHKSKPTTLVRYSEEGDISPIYNYEIAFYSSLYQNRPIIAAPNATVMQVIDTLCSVQTNNAGESFSSSGFLVESLWYELLREAPGLWVSGIINVAASKGGSLTVKKKKKKRHPSMQALDAQQNKKGKT